MSRAKTISIIKELASELKPSEFIDYRSYLTAFFNVANEKVDSYSLRQFEKDLDIGLNAAKAILTGKRKLTIKTGEKITEALGLPELEKNYLLDLIRYNSAKDESERQKTFEQLIENRAKTQKTEVDQGRFEFYSEWYHAVIREMIGTPGFQQDATWIAQQLRPRIRPKQAEKSLDLLLRLGLIKLDVKTMKLVKTDKILVSPSKSEEMSIIKGHYKMIELAKNSITAFDPEYRDINAITLSLSKTGFDELKKVISAFNEKVIAIESEHGEGNCITQVNTQIFPLVSPEENLKD